MKVIGLAGSEYIATFSHDELERFFNLYYGKMEKLRVGSEVDLGKGFNFAHQAASALRDTAEFIKSNQKVVDTILNGMNYIALAAEAKPAEVQS